MCVCDECVPDDVCVCDEWCLMMCVCVMSGA